MNRRSVTVDRTVVGDGQRTYVVAELGINHGGDLRTACTLASEAARAGASAIKLQTYRTEARVAKDSPIYGVLKAAELSASQQGEVIAEARHLGIAAFSTPFDDTSVEELAKLGVPAFKIASFDVVNHRLLRTVAAHRLPVIMSRGMASQEELDAALEILEAQGCPCVILHCVSAYPTPPEQANLRVIEALRARYQWPIGYSDHTIGVQAAPAAVAMGAVALEKHFTLDKSAPGPDHALSADPADLRELVARVRQVEKMLGSGRFQTFEAERSTLQYRRATR